MRLYPGPDTLLLRKRFIAAETYFICTDKDEAEAYQSPSYRMLLSIGQLT